MIEYNDQETIVLQTTRFCKKSFSFDISIQEENNDLDIELFFDEHADMSRTLVRFKIADEITPIAKTNDVGEKVHKLIVDWFTGNFKPSEEALSDIYKISEKVWDFINDYQLD